MNRQRSFRRYISCMLALHDLTRSQQISLWSASDADRDLLMRLRPWCALADNFAKLTCLAWSTHKVVRRSLPFLAFT